MQINSVNFLLFRINLNSSYLESLLITYLESFLISYLESILIIIYPLMAKNPPHGKEPSC